jgi:hypothetical protein
LSSIRKAGAFPACAFRRRVELAFATEAEVRVPQRDAGDVDDGEGSRRGRRWGAVG